MVMLGILQAPSALIFPKIIGQKSKQRASDHKAAYERSVILYYYGLLYTVLQA